MRNFICTLTTALILLSTNPATAQERFAGDWRMKRSVIEVTVQSWGLNCGVKPKSIAGNPNTPVRIKESGGDLIFSNGNIRTDACGSMNPKIRSVLAKKSDGRWKRICKTMESDPKSEQGEYLLEAADENRLEYTATSKYDWTLKGDHCIASSVERRTYVRENPSTGTSPSPPLSKSPDESPPTDAKTDSSPSKNDFEPPPECLSPGPAVRVEVSPRSAVIGPGERVCLAAEVVDAHGCPTAKDKRIVWTASQDGHTIPRLMSSSGCFQAGDTAADSEGTYTVTAAVRGKTATAEITVAFPDLGELFAARLRPLEDADAGRLKETSQDSAPVLSAPPTVKKGEEQATAPSPTPFSEPASSPNDRGIAGYLLAVIVAAMVLLVVAAVIFLKIRRRALDREDAEDDNFDQSLLVGGYPEFVSPPAERISSPSSTRRVKGKICPVCGRKFDIFAKFCPYDKSDLNLIPSGSSEAPTGMICPKCHRGYEGDAQFCPHDAAKLIPYSEWRLSKLPPAP